MNQHIGSNMDIPKKHNIVWGKNKKLSKKNFSMIIIFKIYKQM